jgi:hypothetical protein
VVVGSGGSLGFRSPRIVVVVRIVVTLVITMSPPRLVSEGVRGVVEREEVEGVGEGAGEAREEGCFRNDRLGFRLPFASSGANLVPKVLGGNLTGSCRAAKMDSFRCNRSSFVPVPLIGATSLFTTLLSFEAAPVFAGAAGTAGRLEGLAGEGLAEGLGEAVRERGRSDVMALGRAVAGFLGSSRGVSDLRLVGVLSSPLLSVLRSPPLLSPLRTDSRESSDSMSSIVKPNLSLSEAELRDWLRKSLGPSCSSSYSEPPSSVNSEVISCPTAFLCTLARQPLAVQRYMQQSSQYTSLELSSQNSQTGASSSSGVEVVTP